MSLNKKEADRLLKSYGPWALVTGASSGIGRELAILLAGAGFKLILNANDPDRLQQTADAIRFSYPAEIVTVAADNSRGESLEKLIEQTKQYDIGLLILCAGFGTSGAFAASDLAAEIKMLQVNTGAVLTLTHYFLHRLSARGHGGMILLSSLVAFQGVPYSANYAATKAWVQSFAEALQVEMKHTGIDILSAAPGPVHSGFGARAGMKMGAAPSAADIATPILEALGKQSHVVPGWLGKLLTYSLRTAPRFLKVRIMGKIMQGFTAHRQQR
jgi:short-subunit dehydrogenase